MLLQVRSPAWGDPPSVGLLEGPSSKPPLPLEGAGAISGIWQVILGKDGGSSLQVELFSQPTLCSCP